MMKALSWWIRAGQTSEWGGCSNNAMTYTTSHFTTLYYSEDTALHLHQQLDNDPHYNLHHTFTTLCYNVVLHYSIFAPAARH